MDKINCLCRSVYVPAQTTAYTKSPEHHHFPTKDCPGPTAEAAESPLALHTLEHSENEIQTCPGPTVILNELQFWVRQPATTITFSNQYF